MAAQPEDAALRAAELFDLGIERKRAGDLEGACQAFGESQALAPALGTQLNVAACLEREGKIEEARAMLRRTAEEAEQRDDVARAEHAREELAALEQRHPTAKPETAKPETAKPETAKPESAKPADPGEPRAAVLDRRRERVGAMQRPGRAHLVVGVAAAGLIVGGAAMLVQAHGLQADAERLCPQPGTETCDWDPAQEKNDLAVSRSRLAVGMMIGGAVMGGAAAYLWRKERRKERRWRPVVSAGGDGAMVMVEGVWR